MSGILPTRSFSPVLPAGAERTEWLTLLRTDQLQRWQTGNPLPVEAYLEQYPSLGDDPELVLDLIGSEFLFRRQRGEKPRLEEYLERFPAFQDQLPHRLPFALPPAEGLAANIPGTLSALPSSPPHVDQPPTLPSDAGPGRSSSPPSLPTDLTGTPADQLADSGTHLDGLTQGSSDVPITRLTEWTGPSGERSTLRPGPAVSPSRTQVAGYEVLGELGRGGMGVVYKARQLGLNRTVALKMILGGGHARPEQLDRFKLEAESVARLQHPNVIQIYEVGEQDGLPYFSLEYVDGGSLDRRIAGTPQPARAMAVLVEKLARAMHAAHQRGIVHRDLKPANVLLAPRADAGPPPQQDGRRTLEDFEPKVTDFGLAKQLDDPEGQTLSGAVMGTPSYMAPEQAEGRIRDIGPVTDVYALCAILYELLTGRPPFKGATAWDTVHLVRTQDPVAPRQLQPSVPRDLETICLKGLQKEARKRYASAEELAEDLRHFLANEPIRARPVGSLERAWKWARRRPAQAALAGSLVLTLLVGAFGAVVFGLYKDQQATASQQREAALRQQVERRRTAETLWLQGQEAEGTGRLEEAAEKWDRALATLDADADADRDLRDRVAERRERIRRVLQEQDTRRQLQARVKRFFPARDAVLFREINPAGDDPVTNREQLRGLARAALAPWGVASGGEGEAGQGVVVAALERDRTLFESPEQAARVAAGCYEVLLVWAEAEADVPAGRPAPERQAGARQALALLDTADALGKAYGLPAPRAFHVRRARYLAQAGEAQAARAEAEQAGRLEPTTALDFFLTALDGYRRGQQAQAGGANEDALLGRFAEAASSCDEALRRQPEHFWAQYLQVRCQLKARKWPEARAGATACLARRPDFFWARLFRAYAETEQKDFGPAERDFTEALGQATDPLARYAVLTNRAVFFTRQSRWDEALADLNQAIALRPGDYQAHAILAQVQRGRKDLDAAAAALDQALARRPRDAGLYHTRARAHLERGDRTSARRDFEQAIALEPPGSTSERLASDLVELGHLQHRSREYQSALVSFQRALRVRPGYPPAHLQRAETLLALGRHAEAGEALDQYLRARAVPTADVYKARALIHARLREYRQAVESYTHALRLRRDADTLAQRGRVFLRLDSFQLALQDFEEALGLDPGHPDALCGRGHARLSLGRVADAVADAEEALRRGPRKEQFLFNVACLYARASGQAAADTRGRTGSAEAAARYRERSLALLQDALERVPRAQRASFWHQTVQPEPALAPLRGSTALERLARIYGS